jgi:hypothetical protein
MTHVQIPEYTVFFSDRVEGKPVDRFLRTPDRGREPFRAQPEALDLLGVRYLVVHRAYRDFLAGVAEQYPVAFEDDAARVTVFENPDAYPRVRLASRLVPTATPSEQPRWSATVAVSGDRELLAAARETGVDVGHLPGTDGGSEDGADPGVAGITSETSTEVRVAVDAARPAVLVLGDAFHADWHATIDGEDAPLGLVDETLRGVVVPAGSSEVVFSYRPVARDLGAAVSVVGILGLLGMAGGWALRDRRRAAARVSRPGRARRPGGRSRPA